jgi:hypothetical protein
MKRSDKKAEKWAKEFVDGLPGDILETMQRKPKRLACTCINREPRKPHRSPCPLTGAYAGRVQPSKPMTPRQVEQRQAFDARRVVLPESIAAELRGLICYVVEHPEDVAWVKGRLRDAFPALPRNSP